MSLGYGSDGRRIKLYGTSVVLDQFRRVQLAYTYLPNEVEKAFSSGSFTSEEPKITDFGSREERMAFHNLIGTTGTDWPLMSERIGTKSPTQVSFGIVNAETMGDPNF